MVTDYKIVFSRDCDFEEAVRFWILAGWLPSGAPVYANSYWHQAMIKEDDGKSKMEKETQGGDPKIGT